MKKRISYVLVLAMLLSLAVSCGTSGSSSGSSAPAGSSSAASSEPAPAPAETITLRLTSDHTEDYVTSKAVLKFADLVKERTNGEVIIEPYFNSVLGSNKDALEQAQYGGIDIALCSASLMAEYYDEFNALQMPFVFKDKDHFWRVLNGDIGMGILQNKVLQDKGLYGLCWLDGGSRSFYFAKNEVHTPADMANLTMRVQSSSLMMGMITAMGATPTAMSSSEIYSSLQTGVIDGAENNLPFYISQSHYEVAPYVTMDEHTRAADMLMMSVVTMEKLTDAQKDIICQAALEASEYQREIWTQSEKESEQQVKDLGCTITYLTSDEMQQFMDAVKELNATEGAKYAATLEAIANA